MWLNDYNHVTTREDMFMAAKQDFDALMRVNYIIFTLEGKKNSTFKKKGVFRRTLINTVGQSWIMLTHHTRTQKGPIVPTHTLDDITSQ